VSLNNKIYAIGGRENNNEIRMKGRDSLAVYTIEEYDVETDRWIIKSVLPFKHFTIGAVTLNNKIYILSDTTNNSMMGQSAILEEYDPASNKFSVKSDLIPSKCDAAVSVCNNKIYIFGGWRRGALSSVEVYHPEQNIWIELEEMPYIVQNHQAVTVDDKIYISGGINYISQGVNEKKDILLIYKPDGIVSK
jgi:N-acetylneuraminic acid mutarotase